MTTTIGGRYRVLSSLGRGGMGEVFLAQDQLLLRKVAIKKIISGVADAEAVAVERLVREARAAAMVQHPNVVAVHDLLIEDGQTYIIMEYVDAPTLAELMRSGQTLSPTRVAQIGQQVAGALSAAHLNGVVHRDVKPSNIMVDDAGRARLADFGVARSSGDSGLTGTGNMIGSVAYMAPEVARGAEASAASDVYSLGATLFAAVEGHAPHTHAGEASTSVQVLIRLVTEPAPACTKGGPVARIIDQMLSTDPVARPSAAEVQRTLGLVAPRLTPALAPSTALGSRSKTVPDGSAPDDDRTMLRGERPTGRPANPALTPPIDATLLRSPQTPDAGRRTTRGKARPILVSLAVLSAVAAMTGISSIAMNSQGATPQSASLTTGTSAAPSPKPAPTQHTETVICESYELERMDVKTTKTALTVTVHTTNRLTSQQSVDIQLNTDTDSAYDYQVDLYGGADEAWLAPMQNTAGADLNPTIHRYSASVTIPKRKLKVRGPLRVNAKFWEYGYLSKCLGQALKISWP